MCPGTQNRKTDLNSLSLLRNKAWQARSTSEKQQLVKPTGNKRTHFILRNQTLLLNHHRRALRAGHTSMWEHFLQLTLKTAGCCHPGAQRKPKIKETNNSVPWTVLLNSPRQTFGSQGKRLFLHHSPSHVLLETDLESHFSDPRNACREMWKQFRQEEHTKEPRSAEHLHQTKPILGNTNVQLFPLSASEESIHWIWGQTAASCRGRGAAQNSTSVLLTLCYLSSPACSSARSSFWQEESNIFPTPWFLGLPLYVWAWLSQGLLRHPAL